MWEKPPSECGQNGRLSARRFAEISARYGDATSAEAIRNGHFAVSAERRGSIGPAETFSAAPPPRGDFLILSIFVVSAMGLEPMTL